MIIKSSLFGVDVAEVPTTLHPDGRKAHAPHLRTIRDGWRTLRFFLMYSPRWLFLTPGLGLLLAACSATRWRCRASRWRRDVRRPHAAGRQPGGDARAASCCSSRCSPRRSRSPRADARRPADAAVPPLGQRWSAGLIVGVGGVCRRASACWRRRSTSGEPPASAPLDYATTMRWVIPGVTLAALGCQTMFSSFFISILRMARKR